MVETPVSQGFRWGNAFRFSPREMVVLVCASLPLLLVVPWALSRLVPLRAGPDYRVPYEFSSDYWHIRRWYRAAARSCPVLVVGDSLVWGEYVSPEGALSAQLNRVVGARPFANLGLNGLHPMAMHGLFRHHARGVDGSHVLLVLNPLWLSSPHHDLRAPPDEEDEERLNHPDLMPQFFGAVPAYRPPVERRLSALVRRVVPCLDWVAHLKLVDRRGGTYNREEAVLALASGRARPREPHVYLPRFSPLRALWCPEPQPGPGPHGSPVDWQHRGIRTADIAWPEAGESLQLKAFMRTAELLESRGNRVFVLVSPFNPYILSGSSREAYDGLVNQIERRLAEADIPHFACPAPASELYADASHPLADGYAGIARDLGRTRAFREWIGPVVGREWDRSGSR